MALATKAQSQKIFEKLKTKPANKVCEAALNILATIDKVRYVLIAGPKTQHGLRYHSAYTFALIAPRITET